MKSEKEKANLRAATVGPCAVRFVEAFLTIPFFFFLFVVFLGAISGFGAVKTGENILLNGRFEADQRDFPPFWTPTTDGAVEVHASGGPRPGIGYISLTARKDGRPSSLSIRQAGHKLVKGGVYRLSAAIRTSHFKSENAGVAIASAGWLKDARIKDIPEDTGGEWKQLTREFTCFEGSSYFAVLFMIRATGTLEIADVRLEAIDAKALAETEAPELGRSQTIPRLIPFSPILEKIPEWDRRVTFRFFGKLPAGVNVADCAVVISCEGDVIKTDLREVGADISVTLPPAWKEGVLCAQVVTKADGKVISEDKFRYRVEARARVVSEGHRRLNNLATEVLAAKLGGKKKDELRSKNEEFAFTTTRDGWVYVAAKGDVKNAQIVVDNEKSALARMGGIGTGETFEAIHQLKAGAHTLNICGAGEGSVVVRQITEILSYAPGPSWIPENGGFGWEFQEKYVLPGITTMDGASGHCNETRARGYAWIGNMAASWGNVEEVLSMLKNYRDKAKASAFDGVSCDEFVFADSPRIDVCGRGLQEYEIRYPADWRVMTWMVGKPSVPGVDHAFFASGVNVSRGNGSMLFEAYCRTKGSEEEALGYIDAYIGDTMRRYRDWYPLVIPSTFVVLGNFTQMPILSLQSHPEVDYKYFLDMQMNFVANNPACRDLGGVGYWGAYYADEETHRWSYALTRHYVFEGNTNMLSGKYGYAYLPKLVRDGDFREGLKAWQAAGNVRAASYENLGSIQRRWGGSDGVGHTYARFTKEAGTMATLTQHITGLEAGKMYRLEFLSFDVKDLENKRVNPKENGIRVEDIAGVKYYAPQCWRHVDNRTKGAAEKLPRMVINNLVFTAEKSEITLTLSNRAAQDGDELGVNFVRLTPYLPR